MAKHGTIEYFQEKYGKIGAECHKYFSEGYSLCISYDGDLVAYLANDGWQDYDMYTTYDLSLSHDGVVLQAAQATTMSIK